MMKSSCDMPTKKILVIDDEPSICRLLVKFLRQEGYEAASAKDAQEALAYLSTEKPDVIFLDIKLPGIDGIDILKMIKKQEKGISVVMISGHASENTARDSLILGAFEYINKPIDLMRVRDVLVRIQINEYANGGIL
ncbi:MAG: response regulator [bacterium]